MPICNKYRITGRGSVLIGTIESGKAKKGDELEVKGFDHKQNITVQDLQVFNKSVPEVGNLVLPYF
jgi:elongation factor Tu